MAHIINERVTADHAGELVIFIIGMRINRLVRPDKWLPVMRAMAAMLTELHADPESGFLGAENLWKSPRQPVLIQYWRSFEALDTYANDPAREHRPAWTRFNRAARGNSAVGIFHETYVVRAGCSETLYAAMPPFGLGKVAGMVPALGSRQVARDRIARS